MDFSKLTEKQRHVLGRIAMNMDKGHHPKILKILLDKEFIDFIDVTINSSTVRHYYVPIPVHIAWCTWCAERYKQDEL